MTIGTRIILIGILYAGPQYTVHGEIIVSPVPTQNRPVSQTSIPNNLGYVIKATEIEILNKVANEKLQSSK